MRLSNTGIYLEETETGSLTACPFHPPKQLEAENTAHQCKLTQIPIKPGLDYTFIDLQIAGPFPWRLKWKRTQLVLGFVERHWAKLPVENDDIDKLEVGQWFHCIGDELLIDRTSSQGTRIHLVRCSQELSKFLFELDPETPLPLLEKFASDGAKSPLRSGQMNAATQTAATAIAQPGTNGIGHRLHLEARILSWIAETMNQSASANQANQSTINAEDRDSIERIATQIKEDPGHEYSLHELCEIGRINEHKLKSAFKSIFGKTAFSYLREVRMDFAAELLRADRLSVIQVANEVGYSNASHFARAFKERHSLLPKAYQCLHRL
ncbi:MAG: AraC family transcriptional regulator [Verrucomicrobiota bacterium]